MIPLKKFERKLDRYAIPNLTWYLVGGQGLALLLAMTVPGLVGNMVLVPMAVLDGEWWRLLSFVFTPPFGSPILAIFALYFLWFMGSALEQHWGTFRYNLYVLIGYLVTIAAAFAFPAMVATNTYITGSIFLAFAYLFPNFEILLFLILPVRVKWLALVTWLYFGYQFIFGDWAARLLMTAAVANFLVFFGSDLIQSVRYGRRRIQSRAQASADRETPRHVCAICGVNEKTHPMMDFRYCSKCDPPVAYCADHLRAHEHRVGNGSQGQR